MTAHQAPLSMRLSRQEYWSGLPLPSPYDVLLIANSLADLEYCENIWIHVSCECHENPLFEGVGPVPVGSFVIPY